MTDPRNFVTVGVGIDTTMTVTRTGSNTDRPQGLVLDADDDLSIGEHRSSRLVLWSTTAPAVVKVVTTGAGEIRMWNVWRNDELVQAWQGSAGIELDDEGDDLRLRCSDGHGEAGADLVVRIGFDRAWTQPRPTAPP